MADYPYYLYNLVDCGYVWVDENPACLPYGYGNQPCLPYAPGPEPEFDFGNKNGCVGVHANLVYFPNLPEPDFDFGVRSFPSYPQFYLVHQTLSLTQD